MDFNSLLLLAVIWLLWQIHRDLSESNDGQRSLKTALQKVANRFEQAMEQPSRRRSTRSGERAKAGASNSES